MRFCTNKYLIHKNLILNSYTNFHKLGYIDKITLNFSFKDFLKKNNKKEKIFLFSIFFYKLFFFKFPKFVKSKKIILILNIKKNTVVSCKVDLVQKKDIEKFIIFFTNYLKSFSEYKLNPKKFGLNTCTIYIKNILSLNKKIEFFFDFFSFLPLLSISFTTNLDNRQKNIDFFRSIGLK